MIGGTDYKDDLPQDALCKCGHDRSQHAEKLPAPCKHGQTNPMALSPTEDGYGCGCCGFSPACPEEPGTVYRHFKGGLYELVHPGVPDASEGRNGREIVLYRSAESSQIWARASEEFWGFVTVGGVFQRRFSKEGVE